MYGAISRGQGSLQPPRAVGFQRFPAPPAKWIRKLGIGALTPHCDDRQVTAILELILSGVPMVELPGSHLPVEAV